MCAWRGGGSASSHRSSRTLTLAPSRAEIETVLGSSTFAKPIIDYLKKSKATKTDARETIKMVEALKATHKGSDARKRTRSCKAREKALKKVRAARAVTRHDL